VTDCEYVPAGDEALATFYIGEGKTCLCDQFPPHQSQLLRTYFAPGTAAAVAGGHLSPWGGEQIAPRARRALSVGPSFQPGALWVTAGHYIGVIALGDLRIIIRPKVSIHNLFYMLECAYDLPEFLRQSVSLAEADDLFEFIVRKFLDQIESLVQRGIYRTYVTHDENQPFLRGRLLLADHLHRNVPVAVRFAQRISEYTGDVLENRILKYTLWLLSRLDFCRLDLRLRIRRLASAFAEVSLTPVSPLDCDQVKYTRLNERYRNRINLARLIIRNLSLEGRTGSTRFASYLFDMSDVFELFVARFLKRHFATDPAIRVESQQGIWLDEDKKEEGIPDIVLGRDDGDALVLDTKYKVFDKKPEEHDRDQVLVYCLTQGWKQAVLVYPNDADIQYQRKIKGVRLSAMALSLHGSLTEFKDRCRDFASGFAENVFANPKE
jgi:5-methylcytosine-specific restriction enzyme subunit McrC